MSLWKKKDKSKDKESSKSDAKPPKPKKSKVNTIWAACEQGDVEVFDKMMKKKNGISLVNSPNEEGRYPIHIASGSGQVTLVQRLLECGAQCNMIENTEDRWNVLQWAVKSHNFQMMKLIASQPSLKRTSPIHILPPLSHIFGPLCSPTHTHFLADFRGPSSGTSHMDRNSALHIFAKTFEEDPEDIISLIVQVRSPPSYHLQPFKKKNRPSQVFLVRSASSRYKTLQIAYNRTLQPFFAFSGNVKANE